MSGELAKRREWILDGSIRANKILPERRDAYARMWNQDPVATERLLDELAPGFPQPGQAQANPGVGEGLPRAWFGANATRPDLPSAAQVEAEGLPWVPRRKSAQAGRVTMANDA
jgi:hypothetical protein